MGGGGVPTPSFYLSKSEFTSTVHTVDSTGKYKIFTGGTTTNRMILDAKRGYAYKIIVGTLGMYWNYTYKSTFTVSVWLKYTGINTLQFHSIFGLCDSVGNYISYIMLPDGTPNQVNFGGVSFANVPPLINTNPEWFMITVTYDGSIGGIYVNGTAYVKTDNYPGLSIMNKAGQMAAGSLSPTVSAVSGNGLLSSVYVWDQVLTPAQINTVYATT